MELKIKRGTDLRLVGAVVDVETVTEVLGVHSVAIIPEDFPGFVPKASVNAGDMVKAGSPLLYDKYNQQVVLVSPISGVVRDVERGADARSSESSWMPMIQPQRRLSMYRRVNRPT